MKYLNADQILPAALAGELKKYVQGESLESLANRYYLSVYTIRKIIYQN